MEETLLKQLRELTFEKACKALKLNAKKVLPDFSAYPARHRRSMKAHAKIVLVVEAANMIANNGKRWVADFVDDEPKYEVWWKYEAGRGSAGFLFCRFNDWHSRSGVGSRLSFVSDEVAEAITRDNAYMVKLYNEYL